MRHLAEAWLRTTGRVGAHDDVAGAGADLLARYVQPHRAYHDLAHLSQVLSRIDELGGSDACRLAAWFHDAVYDPNGTDNEARSARLAEEVLRDLRVPDVLVAEVARLVELTATHDPDPDDHDGAVLCDADLAVLASGPEEYGRYVEGVRREYQHLDDALFARGRGDVLRRLLARDPLFSTELGRVEWEARARANVERELRSLAR